MSNLPNFTKPQAGTTTEDQPVTTDATTQPSVETELTDAAGVQPSGDNLSTIEWMRKELEKTRKEAAARRIEANEAKRKLEARNREDLEKQGEFQRLYETTKAELETKQLEIEAQNIYRTAFEEMLRKRIAGIPEAMRALVPTDYEPIKLSQWLDDNETRLGSRKFPNLNAGEGGSASTNGAPKVDPQELELRRKLGLAPKKP